MNKIKKDLLTKNIDDILLVSQLKNFYTQNELLTFLALLALKVEKSLNSISNRPKVNTFRIKQPVE